MNLDKIEYIWDGKGIKIEVIIPECPDVGTAMDLSMIELKKIGIELPSYLGRVEWNDFLYHSSNQTAKEIAK